MPSVGPLTVDDLDAFTEQVRYLTIRHPDGSMFFTVEVHDLDREALLTAATDELKPHPSGNYLMIPPPAARDQTPAIIYNPEPEARA
jgi:hypothetical protein